MFTDDAQFVAELLLDAGCVELNVKEPFRYSSGIISPIYCDNRLLMSDLKRRRKVIELWVKMIQKKNISFDVIGGTALAGIAPAAWLSDLMGVPMIYVRTEKKGHGRRNKIEGSIKEGATVLVVDDLFSTGGSCLSAVEAIRESGGKVTDATAIFSYELQTAKQNFESANCAIHPLCTFNTLIDLAVKEKRLPQEEADVALKWAHDPQTWGEKTCLHNINRLKRRNLWFDIH